MSKFDYDYVEMLKFVLARGEKYKDENNGDIVRVSDYNFKFDLQEEDPILQVFEIADDEKIKSLGLAECVEACSDGDVIVRSSLDFCHRDNSLNLYFVKSDYNIITDLPLDVLKASMLLKTVAEVRGLKAGKINYYLENPYVEINQLEQMKELVKRFSRYRELLDDYKNDVHKFTSYEQCLNLFLDALSSVSSLEETPYIKDARLDKRIIDMIESDKAPSIWVDDSLFYCNSNLEQPKIKNYKHLGRLEM